MENLMLWKIRNKSRVQYAIFIPARLCCIHIYGKFKPQIASIFYFAELAKFVAKTPFDLLAKKWTIKLAIE